MLNAQVAWERMSAGSDPSISAPGAPAAGQFVGLARSLIGKMTIDRALLVFLVAINVVRTLRHAMWRDELQIFMIAANSATPAQFFYNLKYEPHPALWYALVWLVTRFSSDPLWMQLLHIGLAIGVWFLVYRCSPFNRLEKFLLLLTYFLFWEYFVISRSYVLLALIGFGFVALRERKPRPVLALWLMLGLLANVHAFGAIWSIVLAAMLVIETPQRTPALMAGATTYLALLAFSIVTMAPVADFGPWASDVRFALARLNADLVVPFGAFVPLTWSEISEAIVLVTHPTTGAVPQFWNVNPAVWFAALTHADIDHPLRLALVFAAPIAVCWLIVRNPVRMMEFALVYVGIVLFENIWDFKGTARHHGVVFLAFVATVWTAPMREKPDKLASSLFTAVLAINAIVGMLTLVSELRPFSEGKAAAEWIKQNGLAGAFLIGWGDAPVSSVAGYLGRPLYYLECQCFGTFIVWNGKRQPALSAARLASAVGLAGQQDAILIRNRPLLREEIETDASGISATLLQAFVNAYRRDENFWIYRLDKKE
jgi:hypothetical protein